MSTSRTEVILTSKLPSPDVAWEGKMMAVRQNGKLYLPVAFCREGAVPLPHRDILDSAGFKGVRRRSPENMGGCLMKVFMGTVVLWSSSGELGPLKEQDVLVPHIKAGLREFLLEMGIVVSEVDAEDLDALDGFFAP
jgi:hypothetical protein